MRTGLDRDQGPAFLIVLMPGMIMPTGAIELLIEPLSRDVIASVFPLMQAVNPSLSSANWRQFARQAGAHPVRAQRGILIARRPTQRFPVGAVCYRRHHDVGQGAILTAEHYVALDLLYPDRVIEALIAGLEPVALRLGCRTIRSIVHGSEETLIETLHGQGHAAEAVTMTKRVKG